MIFLAVFTVSLTSLCYEVLLTRFFSFSQWNHLSFMVISIVLFGFGASGSVLSLIEKRRPGWSVGTIDSQVFLALMLLCSLSIGGSFLAVKNIPLDYFRMPLELRQVGYLLTTFLVLLVPFFFAGGVMSIAFAGLPDKSGWIYSASMVGSATGALLPALLLPRLGEGRIVFSCASLLLLFPFLRSLCLPRDFYGSCSTGIQSARRTSARITRRLILCAAGVLFLLNFALLLYKGGGLLEIYPSPYKLLPQVLQFPDTSVVARSNTIRGRLDRLDSPYIRFAPGLSLKYQGTLPQATFLIQDGDGLLVLYDLEGGLDFSRYLHSYAGYLLPGQDGPAKVLVLQQGGGLSLPCAVSAGAKDITVLLDHGEAADLYRARTARKASDLQPNIRVVAGNMRRYLARNHERYQRIQLESWGPSIPGMASLNQEHLLTVEAFSSYLDHLTTDGIFILSRKLLLPPMDILKVFATAFTSLEAVGVENPGRHILLLRGWDSYTILCSPAPFDQLSIAKLREFCRERNFDLVFFEGMEAREANQFNSFPEAYHFQEIQGLYQALREVRSEDYYRSYYLDIAPARDDRPFHRRFTRWLKLGSLYRSTGSRFYTLFLSGETVVVVVLGIAVVLGVLLLLLPRLLLRDPSRHTEGTVDPIRPAAAIVYFLAAGAGFMFVEMAFLQSYTFVFGNPVIAFTVVLAELLVVSGIGGAISAQWNRRVLPLLLVVLVVCVMLLYPLSGRLGEVLLQASGLGQALGSFLVLAPVALLVGVPFPVGLRLLVSSPRLRAYGWAANGIASVVASILALPLAMTWGISRLLLLAAVSYALMLGALLSGERASSTGG
jgi:hypothetical protein